MSAGASAAQVEAALEGLEPTGDLTVTRSMNSENGYDWQVRLCTQRVQCSLAVFRSLAPSLRGLVLC